MSTIIVVAAIAILSGGIGLSLDIAGFDMHAAYWLLGALTGVVCAGMICIAE